MTYFASILQYQADGPIWHTVHERPQKSDLSEMRHTLIADRLRKGKTLLRKETHLNEHRWCSHDREAMRLEDFAENDAIVRGASPWTNSLSSRMYALEAIYCIYVFTSAYSSPAIFKMVMARPRIIRDLQSARLVLNVQTPGSLCTPFQGTRMPISLVMPLRDAHLPPHSQGCWARASRTSSQIGKLYSCPDR